MAPAPARPPVPASTEPRLRISEPAVDASAAPDPSPAVAPPAVDGEGKQEVLEAIGASRSHRWKKVAWIAAAIAVVVTVTILLIPRFRDQDQGPQWREAAVDRGDIVVKVGATGTLQPERTVSVGAEVSGRVQDVLVDHNDIVTEGQVLARLELDTFTNGLREAQASQRAAATEITRARATLEEAKASAARAESLSNAGIVSDEERLMRQTASSVASAALRGARAQYSLAEVRVEQAQDSLDKAVITSPIDGIVLQRYVEPGNAIAAALQAPELFVIAENLQSMVLLLDIDEADVGELKVGQSGTFTVDAWPDKTFHAKVAKIYFAPKTAANVVTYTAELEVANDELLLRPGMTATAQIVTRTRTNVLRAPNTALRFTPPEATQDGGFQMGPPRADKQRAHVAALWVQQDGVPVHKDVALGATDGYFTEVTAQDGLAEGTRVLVGVQEDANP